VKVQRLSNLSQHQDRIANLKGAFIQIMPLTWDSFLLPVMDRHPGLTI
jgi:hypothetical protein